MKTLKQLRQENSVLDHGYSTHYDLLPARYNEFERILSDRYADETDDDTSDLINLEYQTLLDDYIRFCCWHSLPLTWRDMVAGFDSEEIL